MVSESVLHSFWRARVRAGELSCDQIAIIRCQITGDHHRYPMIILDGRSEKSIICGSGMCGLWVPGSQKLGDQYHCSCD